MLLVQDKKKSQRAPRFHPLLGRSMRIITIPCGKRTSLLVDKTRVEMENDEDILHINKGPGFWDEGIVIRGVK